MSSEALSERIQDVSYVQETDLPTENYDNEKTLNQIKSEEKFNQNDDSKPPKGYKYKKIQLEANFKLNDSNSRKTLDLVLNRLEDYSKQQKLASFRRPENIQTTEEKSIQQSKIPQKTKSDILFEKKFKHLKKKPKKLSIESAEEKMVVTDTVRRLPNKKMVRDELNQTVPVQGPIILHPSQAESFVQVIGQEPRAKFITQQQPTKITEFRARRQAETVKNIYDNYYAEAIGRGQQKLIPKTSDLVTNPLLSHTVIETKIQPEQKAQKRLRSPSAVITKRFAQRDFASLLSLAKKLSFKIR